MFHVDILSAKDFVFAVQLTDQMNWNLTREDFEFMMDLEPEGCFVLLSDSKKVGVATTVNFGKTAWFGNLIVEESYRGKGAGALLVKHSIKYLKAKNAKAIGLFAYMNTIAFYEKLGFKHDSDFVVLKGKAMVTENKVSVRRARETDVRRIIDFDRFCFLGSRKKLLERLLLNPKSLCFISTENEQMLGYLGAKVYDEVAELGPLVCKQGCSQTAIDLIKTCLNKIEGAEVSLCIAKKEAAVINMLKTFGFREDFCVASMFLGQPFASECIYGAESLERG
jgi:ribosomal protein S18 acetylase RimI-like enzyme